MSEQENNPGGEQSPLAAAVSSTIPEPVKGFAYTDEHTEQNTPMKEFVPGVPEAIRQQPEEAREKGFTTFFLGNGKEENLAAQDLVARWITLTTARDMFKNGQMPESFKLTAENEWNQYVEQTHPGRTSVAVEMQALQLYRFFEGLQDSLLLRTRMMNEPGVTNVSRRSDKLVVADILGKVPGNSVQGFSVSEVMTRATLRSTSAAYQYDVLLRNSFCKLVFTRPAKSELGSLINDINLTVRGYVRQVGHNSLQLATIAGMKAVWNWFHPRIISCSVDKIVDFKDLVQVIRITDFLPLCNAILASIADEGVNMDIGCINIGCDEHTLDLIDPTKLTQIRTSIQTPEEAAILGNIANGRRTYSVAETLAMIEQSTYGLESTSVWNEAQDIKLSIAPPSMADAFMTFDFFSARVDSQLRDIRTKVVDERTLEEQIAIALNSLGAAEFIHWISAFTRMPPKDEDGEPLVLRRAECDSDEFNKGLISALEKDKVLNRAVTNFIYNKVLYMTRTFSGIRNRVCPKCDTPSDANQEPERKLGYTPVDSFMAFFTHTQLILMDQAVTRQEEIKEALS